MAPLVPLRNGADPPRARQKRDLPQFRALSGVLRKLAQTGSNLRPQMSQIGPGRPGFLPFWKSNAPQVAETAVPDLVRRFEPSQA